MAFHKHGMFSFQVTVERMVGVGGDSFSARLTALRLHGPIGAAQPLEVPALRDYGETAPEAEARVIQSMRDWLTASLDTAEKPVPGTRPHPIGHEGQQHAGSVRGVTSATT